jgi:hypothetical protein
MTPASSASVSVFRIRPEFTKKKPPGSGKGVHLFGIQHLDGERHFGIGIPDKILAYAILRLVRGICG